MPSDDNLDTQPKEESTSRRDSKELRIHAKKTMNIKEGPSLKIKQVKDKVKKKGEKKK